MSGPGASEETPGDTRYSQVQYPEGLGATRVLRPRTWASRPSSFTPHVGVGIGPLCEGVAGEMERWRKEDGCCKERPSSPATYPQGKNAEV